MSEIEELIASNEPQLVDFWAEWCGPCRTMNPILAETTMELGDSVTLVKIDADNNRELMMKYSVRSIPTLILFKGGEQLWRHSGIISKDEMVKAINNVI